MKIAYVLAEGYVSKQNGLINQALTWKSYFEELGHTVELINMWDINRWTEFDIVHYFGFSSYMSQHINRLSSVNHRIIVSPILDPDYPVWKLHIISKLGYKTKLTNSYHSFREVKERISLVLARSEFERNYLIKGLGVKADRCVIVPLACEIATQRQEVRPKENFCFHCSLLADKRKNVKRLIEAARKYKFKLVLGGYLRTKEEEQLIQDWIAGASNIEYLGFLPREEMLDLYSRAKVFALPSTNEGVGIVGLEAAALGCDVVLTSYGGPKEYYNGMAKIVNPYSIDEIGETIVDLLNGETTQGELGEHIRKQYAPGHIAKQLEMSYQKLLYNDFKEQ